MRIFHRFLLGLTLMGLVSGAHAVLLTVDEIIYEGSATNTDLLSGTVDMSLSGYTLSMILTNTSTGIASDTASENLLTGIGFNLPDGVWIGGGDAQMGSTSDAVNWDSSVLGTDVSGEWGYDNSPLNSGPFQIVPEGVSISSVNTTVTTMSASTTNAFSSTSLLNPGSLAGPEFGLLSGDVDASTAGGLYAIQDSIVVTMELNENAWLSDGSFDLIDWIDQQDVVLSFGSPTSTASVPEPWTLSLFSLGLVGMAWVRRKSA